MRTDAEIKQQLSSLKYVKSVCESSIDRLNKGVDDTDYMVSAVSIVSNEGVDDTDCIVRAALIVSTRASMTPTGFRCCSCM